MKLYKWLNGNQSCYAGKYTWSLPQNGEPGEWTSYLGGTLNPCVRGYHLCRVGDLVMWLAPDLYEVETRGDVLEAGDKVVVRQCRLLRRVGAWNERTARLFGCHCAEHVLPLFEKQYPNDRRLREMIKTARRYARGEASAQDLSEARAAADAAAWAAAYTATYAAACDASRTATYTAARDAARTAAWAAACAAARTAAWTVAHTVARAARTAAGTAAGATAEDVERAWQTQQLCEMLEIEEEHAATRQSGSP